MPVKELSTQLPVTGTLVAMVAGATFVTAVELTQLYLTEVAAFSPTTAGLLFWTMPVGLVPAAVAFGVLFRTSLLPYLVNLGLVSLTGGVALLLALDASGASSPSHGQPCSWGSAPGPPSPPASFWPASASAPCCSAGRSLSSSCCG